MGLGLVERVELCILRNGNTVLLQKLHPMRAVYFEVCGERGRPEYFHPGCAQRVQLWHIHVIAGGYDNIGPLCGRKPVFNHLNSFESLASRPSFPWPKRQAHGMACRLASESEGEPLATGIHAYNEHFH